MSDPLLTQQVEPPPLRLDMTRGRKKDQTAPPSRSIAQQREYRARKARYVTNLEERCRAAEEENSRLRREIELTKATMLAGASELTLQTVRLFRASYSYPLKITFQAAASSALLHHLNAASSALVHFQELALLGIVQQQGYVNAPPASSLSLLSPTPSNTHHSTEDHRSDANLQPYPPQDQLGVSDENYNSIDDPTFSEDRLSRSPSLGSECCGGWMNCRDLVETDAEDDGVMIEKDNPPIMPTSEVRLT